MLVDQKGVYEYPVDEGVEQSQILEFLESKQYKENPLSSNIEAFVRENERKQYTKPK